MNKSDYELVSLKPYDIVVLLKLVSIGSDDWTKASLAKSVKMSGSVITQVIQRVWNCRLFNRRLNGVNVQALEEFLIHGIFYVFPAHHGPVLRGMPTGAAGPPLKDIMSQESLKWPPVWSDHLGMAQGYSIAPLHPRAADLAREDEKLYELMAIVDTLREGRPREKKLAIDALQERLANYRA